VSTGKLDRGEVVVFEAGDGALRLDVRLKNETVWLSQRHIAELLGTSTDNIGLHLKNIYAEGELDEAATTEESSVVQVEGRRRVTRRVRLYNLDGILSVGYRVNSKRGTQFRTWATSVLREHLVRGYSIHRHRFERNARELEAALELVRRTAGSATLSNDQGRGLVDVIARYTQTFLLLQRHDEGLLSEPKGAAGGVLPKFTAARSAITKLKRDLVARR
jgi:prophage antirepressor-like protein